MICAQTLVQFALHPTIGNLQESKARSWSHSVPHHAGHAVYLGCPPVRGAIAWPLALALRQVPETLTLRGCSVLDHLRGVKGRSFALGGCFAMTFGGMNCLGKRAI